MNQGHYFITAVEVLEGGKPLLSLNRALVSRNGIYQLFPESPATHKAFLEARVFRVEFEGRAWLGRLVREQGPLGAHYNLRLLGVEGEDAEHMEYLLAKVGFSSPWKREHTRLPVSSLSERAEHPATVVFQRVVGQALGEVLNFSTHGLLFEFLASGLSMGEHVGQRIRLNLISSKGRTLHGVEAKIARIYDEMVAPGKMLRGIGVKFVQFPATGEAAYRDLLLNVLEELKSYS